MKEKIYHASLLIFSILSVICGVIGIVFIFMNMNKSADISDEIFGLIYAFFHLILTAFFLLMVINAYKKGFIIFKTLVRKTDSEEISLVARIVAIFFLLLGLFLLIHFALLLGGNKLLFNNFSLSLKIDLVNTGLLLTIINSFFLLYPIIDSELIKQRKEY